MEIAGSVLIKNICCEVVYIPTKVEKSIAKSPLQPEARVRGSTKLLFNVF